MWRDVWLPGSETFIRNQVDALSRWQAAPVASEHVESPVSHGASIVFGTSAPELLRRSRFRAVRRSRAVRRAVTACAPDLVHAHFATDGGLILPTCRAAGIPLVVSVHGYDVTSVASLPRKVRNRVAEVLAGADRISAISGFIADRALQLGADPARVEVIPIGIPVPADVVERDLEDTTRVLFVGRLVEKKGVADAIAAVATLVAAGHRLTLTVVGDGPMRSSVEALAARSGAPVTFAGSMAPPEVSAAMSAHDVFLAPSRTAADGDSEGFGMVFLEAAAHRLPSVAYRHGGVPEAVEDGVSGLLAPEGDVVALTECLRVLVVDPDHRRELGRAGRRRVEERFDVRDVTRDLEDLYDAAAEGVR